MPVPSDATRKEIEDILENQMSSFRYHAAHHDPGALEQVGVQGGGCVWMPRRGQLPKSTPMVPVAEAVSAKGMQILREKGAVRGLIYKTAGRDPLRSPEVVSAALKHAFPRPNSAPPSMAGIRPPAFSPHANAAQHPPKQRLAQSFWDLISSDKGECYFYTGETMLSLKALWDWLDADKAFSQKRQYNAKRDPTKDVSESKRGATTKLTAFQQLVFTLVCFRRLRGRGLRGVACDLFNVSVRLGRQYYATNIICLGQFYLYQLPPLTRSQVARDVPSKTMAALNLPAGTALYMGDCTERFCEDSTDGAIHAALFSQYKDHTTLK